MKNIILILSFLISTLGYSQSSIDALEGVYGPPKLLTPDPLPDYIPSQNIPKYNNSSNQSPSNKESFNFDEEVSKLVEDLSPKKQSYSTPETQRAFTPQGFNSSEENFERFKNSPCYSKIGFIPGYNNEQLYRECEEEYYRKKNAPMIIVLVVLGAILLLVFMFKAKPYDNA